MLHTPRHVSVSIVGSLHLNQPSDITDYSAVQTLVHSTQVWEHTPADSQTASETRTTQSYGANSINLFLLCRPSIFISASKKQASSNAAAHHVLHRLPVAGPNVPFSYAALEIRFISR